MRGLRGWCWQQPAELAGQRADVGGGRGELLTTTTQLGVAVAALLARTMVRTRRAAATTRPIEFSPVE
ncbi:MAG TPA: hypothetical protein VHX38_10565 [Pseudonocardiaceae bacterium]|nr:hypothetical protein [Pseudonocardiaceae bacterium]